MKEIVSELNRAAKAFLNYNAYKQRIMRENDPVGAQIILRFLPLLLHVNNQYLPGYVEDRMCPAGIKVVRHPFDNRQELESFLSSRVSLREIQDNVRIREIEGVFTIGSVGSVGQTRGSDYDIWVVVDAAMLGKHKMELLETKLERIQHWLTSRYLLDVHFFLMDISDIRVNNFGRVSHEGAGSALKHLLKEEFYRTLTLIEGRIPLWWILPADLDEESLAMIPECLPKMKGFQPDDFIDMGSIESIPKQELLGAALWQMHKALSDPLKSVIKMALAAAYLGPGSKAGLLCELVKRRVHAVDDEEIVDPYIEAFRLVEEHYLRVKDAKTVDLLRKCFYLKTGTRITKKDLILVDPPDKIAIMMDLISSWEWSLKLVEFLNGFADWDVDQYRALGVDIHEYLKRTTVLLVKTSRSFLVNMDIDGDVEIEILRRRIEAFYVPKEGKIDCEKRVKKKEPVYEEIYFSYFKGRWEIYKAHPSDKSIAPIMSADRISKIITWLVFNRRFDLSTAFHMLPNAKDVFLSDIQSLLGELTTMIPEASTIGLDRECLQESRYVKHIIIIGNMESPNSAAVDEIDIVYLNSWNELFCLYLQPEDLRMWLQQVRMPDTKISFWLADQGDSRFLARSLMSLVSP